MVTLLLHNGNRPTHFAEKITSIANTYGTIIVILACVRVFKFIHDSRPIPANFFPVSIGSSVTFDNLPLCHGVAQIRLNLVDGIDNYCTNKRLTVLMAYSYCYFELINR